MLLLAERPGLADGTHVLFRLPVPCPARRTHGPALACMVHGGGRAHAAQRVRACLLPGAPSENTAASSLDRDAVAPAGVASAADAAAEALPALRAAGCKPRHSARGVPPVQSVCESATYCTTQRAERGGRTCQQCNVRAGDGQATLFHARF